MTNKPRGDAPPLTCAFDEPWMGPHPKCAAHAAELRQQFRDAVRRGDYDAEGFTPADRRAQTRRNHDALGR